MDTFAAGSPVLLSVTYFDVAGEATTPISPSLVLKPPRGAKSTVTSFDLAEDEVSLDHTFTPTVVGRWAYQWSGTIGGVLVVSPPAYFLAKENL